MMPASASAETMSGWTSKSAKVGKGRLGDGRAGRFGLGGVERAGLDGGVGHEVLSIEPREPGSRVVAAVLRADRRSVVAPWGRAESLSGFSIRADRAPKVCVSLPVQGVGARSAVTTTVVYRIVKAPPAASTASPMPSMTAAAVSGGSCPKNPLVGSWSTQASRV